MLTLRTVFTPRNRDFALGRSDIVACLRLVALDELHCVMTWGDSFQRDFMNAVLQTLETSAQRFNDDADW